jgi:hypothetical protein
VSVNRSSKTRTPGLRPHRSLFGIPSGGGAAALLGGCSIAMRGRTTVPIGWMAPVSVLGVPACLSCLPMSETATGSAKPPLGEIANEIARTNVQ